MKGFYRYEIISLHDIPHHYLLIEFWDTGRTSSSGITVDDFTTKEEAISARERCIEQNKVTGKSVVSPYA